LINRLAVTKVVWYLLHIWYRLRDSISAPNFCPPVKP
jgi:hypothetical protein